MKHLSPRTDERQEQQHHPQSPQLTVDPSQQKHQPEYLHSDDNVSEARSDRTVVSDETVTHPYLIVIVELSIFFIV